MTTNPNSPQSPKSKPGEKPAAKAKPAPKPKPKPAKMGRPRIDPTGEASCVYQVRVPVTVATILEGKPDEARKALKAKALELTEKPKAKRPPKG